MQLWDFEGRCLATLAGAWLSNPSAASTVYVSDKQDLLFIYCPPGSERSLPNHCEKLPDDAADNAARAAAAAAAGPAATEANEAWWWEWSAGADQPPLQNEEQPHAAAAAAAAAAEPTGCIKVFELLKGRQVAVMKAPKPWSGRGNPAPRDAAAAEAARSALRQCSTLFYCEDSRRIYTGTAHGKVQAWAL